MKRKGILLTLVVLLLLVNGTQAMGSANYALDWMIPLTIGGGGASSSPEYTFSGTIGQPDAGILTGGDYILSGGFWTGQWRQELFLSIITR